MSAQPETPTFYTVQELADLFRIDPDTVRHQLKSGWPHLRLGPRTVRFSTENVEQIKELCTNKPPAERTVRTIGTRARRIK
jgi:hypothetical protein